MTEKKLIILIAAVTLIILSGGVYVLSQTSISSQFQTSSNAKLEVNEKSFDWGQISYNGGNVSKTFTLKNSGTDILKIKNIKTSCTCTKAQLTIDEQSSPYFSMHSTSSWVGEVKPNQEAKLTVIFDPAFHGPSGIGPINRLVLMETNDVNSPKLEFTLTGNVIKD